MGALISILEITPVDSVTVPEVFNVSKLVPADNVGASRVIVLVDES
jgi:hypothetical protein